jgi:hypothetical protein
MAWTVAWATENELIDTALQFQEKFSHLVVGTHGYVTSPSVLERFLGLPGFRVSPPSGALFHPKVYAFDFGNETAVVIGSHNLTAAAFSSNIEASILLTGASSEKMFVDLCGSVVTRWRKACVIDDDWLYAYKANYRRTFSSRRELEQWVPIRRPNSLRGETSIQDLDWNAYVALVKQDSTHGLERRLRVLEEISKVFRRADTFESLDTEDRKRIAGTAGKRLAERDGIDWAWFGAMNASPSFSTLVINRPAGFSEALDCIPFSGPVVLADYERYIEKFMAAFIGTPKLGGIANGTRLLAMKRPDQFVCVDGPNKKGICAHFGQSPTTLSLANYWQRIIEPMRQTNWWLEPRPLRSIERRIWDCRAAMLDAIHYDPNER